MRRWIGIAALGPLITGCAGIPASGPSAVAVLEPTKGNAAGGYGNATLTAELDVITIGGGAADIVGPSVIVHKDPDDYKTQPTGNSGARVACGVIRRA